MELSGTLNGGSSRLLPLGFPRGEAKGASRQREAKSLPYRVRRKPLDCSNQRGTLPQSSLRDASSLREGAKGASRQREATSLPYNGRCKIMSLYHSTQYTPSASLCSAASSEREPRALRASGRLRASPTGCGGNHWLAATNGVHSLSQPVRAASSLREGAKGASCRGRFQTGF